MSSSIDQIDTGLREEVLSHVVATVEASPFQDDPFPHVVIEDLFPAGVYDRLLSLLPSPSEYTPFSYDKHSDNGESNRRNFMFTNNKLDKLSGEGRRFWYTLRSVLGSTELKGAMFRKLCMGLAYRYGCGEGETDALPGFALPELFHETTGYYIKPHPDTRKKVVTMQVALPETDEPRNLGTEFYRRSLNPSEWLSEPKGFEVVKTMSFRPNSAYAFVVLNTMRVKSWHGRTKLDSGSGVRNTLLNIWYEKAEHANLDIVAENAALEPGLAAA